MGDSLLPIRTGITIGDINGIGPEIIYKVCRDERLFNHVTPVIFGSSKIMSYHKNIIDSEGSMISGIKNLDHIKKDRAQIFNVWNENVRVDLGKATPISGKYAELALKKAVEAIKQNKIDVLVTAPINKAAMKKAKFPFPGHTEYLTEEFGGGKGLMMLINDELRVAVATAHIPLSEVAASLNERVLNDKITVLYESLRRDFGIDHPKIAVLGLNPHAGEEGHIGSAENDFIIPLINKLAMEDMLIFGPFAADGFFGSGDYLKFDGILAMYHDQGLIPFKALSFGQGVNFTAGLDYIRTSPDHGTAFNLAGKNKANENSLRKALLLAADIYRNRNNYNKNKKNPKPSEQESV